MIGAARGRGPRRGAVVATVAFAAWATVVLVGAFPDVARQALRLVGADPPLRDERPGPVGWPSDVDTARVAAAAWGILGAVALVLAALALGHRALALARLARPGTPGESLVAIALGLTLIALLLMAMGIAHVLTPPAVVALMVLLGAHAALWLAGRRRTLAALPGRLRRGAGRIAGSGVGLAAAAALAVFGLIGLVVALAPEVEFDAVWFHLWLPDEYLRRGFLADQPQEYVSLYPQNMELLYAWGLVWGGTVAAKLVAVAVAGLTAAATWVLARRLLSAPWAAVAVLVAMSAPLMLWESTTTYVDLPLAFLAAVMVNEVVAWRDSRDRVRLVRAGLVLGGALAIKHLALLLLPVVGLILALTPAPPGRGLVRRAGRIALFAGCALAVAAPWYLRAAILGGNPVFPEMYGVFGASPADRWSDGNASALESLLQGYGPEGSPADLLMLPWTLTTRADLFDGEIGPIFLIALPLLALGIARGRRGVGVIAAVAFGFMVLWASPLASFQARFLVTVLPLLAVLVAVALEALAGRLRGAGLPRAALAVPLAAVALTLANVPPLAPWHGRAVVTGPGYAQGWIDQTVREIDVGAAVDGGDARRYIDRRVYGIAAVRWANDNLPARARVLSEVDGVQYYSRRPLIVYFATPVRTALRDHRGSPRLAEALRDIGVGAVITDRRFELEQRLRDAIPDRLTLRYEDDQTRVYTLS